MSGEPEPAKPSKGKGKRAERYLSEADLEQVLEWLAEGQRLSTIARKLMVTPDALRMRKHRSEDFAEKVAAAEAEGEIADLRRLNDAIATGSKTWVGFAWKLERRWSKRSNGDDEGWLSAEVRHRIATETGEDRDPPPPDARFE